MSASGHREIDHTADLGFEIWAPDLPELYAEGVLALAEICYEREAVRPRQTRRLAVREDGREACLVRWLQEVYLLVESELWLAARAENVVATDQGVEGTLYGEPYDRGRHVIHTEIKAITYHGLQISRAEGLWTATVVVDV